MRRRQALVLVLAGGLALVATSAAAQSLSTPTAALTARPGRMAEPAIAVDPRNPDRIAAAADPYLNPTRIIVTLSEDAGITWSTPLTLIPDGFAKSYDPVLQFDVNGDLLVVGGAAGVGQPHCQPNSAIFLAKVSAAAATYRLARDARSDGAFVDRPGFVFDRRTRRSFVSWTESSGPGAACRGLPIASSTMLSRSSRDGVFEPPQLVPTSGLPAAFGSALATDRNGNLVVATSEHDPGKRSRLTLNTLGATNKFGTPTVISDAPDVPFRLRGLGGLFAPIPSLALAPNGRVAVGYMRPSPAGVAPVVLLQTPGGPWTEITPSTAAGTTDLFPQLTFDGANRLWLLSGQLRDRSLQFNLRSRTENIWAEPTVVASGPGDRYLELGEGLGLSYAAGRLAVAVPTDRAADSALLVTSLSTDPPPATTTTPPTTDATVTNAGSRRSPLSAVALGVIGAAALLITGARARRGIRRARRRRT
ncbi:MAG: hypothetical protein Q8K63_04785 [Acidimicrobiales bacterium]|nr:hypothetical protein [Acidimicrobiales bacterium]